MTNKRVIFLLDKSGSMNRILDDTLGGFNTFVDGLKADPENAETEFTLVQFDSSSIETWLTVKVPKVPQLTRENYIPGSATPLYEAVIKSFESADAKDWVGNTVGVIQTDGQENSSKRDYDMARLTTLIAHLRTRGWNFVFLGSGIDNYEAARSMGLGRGETVSYNSANLAQTKAAYAGSAAAVNRSLESNAPIAFSDSFKAEVGDKFFKGSGVDAAAPDPAATADLEPAPRVAYVAPEDHLKVDI